MVLNGVICADAALRADALRLRCAQLDLGLARPVTLSIGVAQWLPGEDSAALLARADGALYQAKAQGRNRVVSVDGTAQIKRAAPT